MTVRFVCACGRVLEASEDRTGQDVSCPSCEGVVTVPPAGQGEKMEFACSSCGAKYRVPAAMAGKRTHCPGCKAALEIPGALPAIVPSVETLPMVESAPVETVKPSASPLPPVPPPLPGSKRTSKTADKAKSDTSPAGAPAKKKVKREVVVLLALCALLIPVGIIVIKMQRERTARLESAILVLRATVRYSATQDTLTVTNEGNLDWTNVTVTINTAGTPWVQTLAGVKAFEKPTLQMRDFKDPQGKTGLDPFMVKPQSIALSARLSNGRQGTRSFDWPEPSDE